jgi:hypothetical protein
VLAKDGGVYRSPYSKRQNATQANPGNKNERTFGKENRKKIGEIAVGFFGGFSIQKKRCREVLFTALISVQSLVAECLIIAPHAGLGIVFRNF